MYQFTIELAGIPIAVQVEHQECFSRCKDYIINQPAEFAIEITGTDTENELKYSTTKNPARWTLEWMALYRKICSVLAERNIVLIHGSCIAVDGQAYLFCAPSGTGKSTHTRLWREYLGKKAVMINDDKPLVRVFDANGKDPAVRIYGTPWNGKHRLGANISAPLKAVCFLQRSEENHIDHLDNTQVLPDLLKFVFRPEDPLATMSVLDTAAKIADFSAFYTLGCNMDPMAAEIAYTAMSEA